MDASGPFAGFGLALGSSTLASTFPDESGQKRDKRVPLISTTVAEARDEMLRLQLDRTIRPAEKKCDAPKLKDYVEAYFQDVTPQKRPHNRTLGPGA